MSDQTQSQMDLQKELLLVNSRLENMEERYEELFTLTKEMFLKVVSLQAQHLRMKTKFNRKPRSKMRTLQLSDLNSEHSQSMCFDSDSVDCWDSDNLFTDETYDPAEDEKECMSIECLNDSDEVENAITISNIPVAPCNTHKQNFD